MNETTSQARDAWRHYECNSGAMVIVGFGSDQIRVAPETREAWRALESVFQAHRYTIRVSDTDSYCCRQIKGGGGKSLHAFGIALDVNWNTNPFKYTPDKRPIRFSNKPTQVERGQDVKLGLADTDMTPDLIDDIRAIKTKDGKRVFEWGGDWHDRKDSMHFELDVTPLALQAGIDWATVKIPSEDLMAASDQRGSPAEIDVIAASTAAPRELPVSVPSAPTPPAGAVPGELLHDAIVVFQSVNGLTPTGVLDEATLRALAGAMGSIEAGGMTAVKPEDLLRLLLGTLAKQGAILAAPPAGGTDRGDMLRQVLAALAGAKPALPAPDTLGSAVTPAVLSPIDKMLGGESLAGGKTAMAVVAYSVLSILQAVGAAGTATGPDASTAGQILTTLIAGFGGLGFIAKIDRAVKSLGLMAAKTAAVPK